MNEDKELWRYNSDSIFVTKQGAIGINCGGKVVVRPINGWHKLGWEGLPINKEIPQEICGINPTDGSRTYGCPHCGRPVRISKEKCPDRYPIHIGKARAEVTTEDETGNIKKLFIDGEEWIKKEPDTECNCKTPKVNKMSSWCNECNGKIPDTKPAVPLCHCKICEPDTKAVEIKGQ